MNETRGEPHTPTNRRATCHPVAHHHLYILSNIHIPHSFRHNPRISLLGLPIPIHCGLALVL
jgi:hypothetical protein